MQAWSILDDLSPHARVATAVIPFLCAMGLRILLGKNWVTQVAITATTVWFVINILLTPYSMSMQQDIHRIVK